MEKLLFVKDIMERYGCTRPTAYKRMHEMVHMKSPLAVHEWAVIAWENGKMVDPNEKPQRGRKTAVKAIGTPRTARIPYRRDEE